METSGTGLTQYVPAANVTNLSDDDELDDELERKEAMKEMMDQMFDCSDSESSYVNYEETEHQDGSPMVNNQFRPNRFDNVNDEYSSDDVGRANDVYNLGPYNQPLAPVNHLENRAEYNNSLSARSEPSYSITSANGVDLQDYNIKLPLSEINESERMELPENKERPYFRPLSSDKENFIPENPYSSDDLQSQFMKSNSFEQLHLLYITRGKELDELTAKLEKVEECKLQEAKRLQHNITLLKAQNDSLETGRTQMQALLTDKDRQLKKTKNDFEEVLKELREEKSLTKQLKMKLETTDSTIASLEQMISEFKSSDAISNSKKMHEDFLKRLNTNHNQKLCDLENDLRESRLQETSLKQQITELETKMKSSSIEYNTKLKNKGQEINKLKSDVENYKLQCDVMLSSLDRDSKDKVESLTHENLILRNEKAELLEKNDRMKSNLEIYENALKHEVFSKITTGDNSILDLKLNEQKKLSYEDSLLEKEVDSGKESSSGNINPTKLKAEHLKVIYALKQQIDTRNELEQRMREMTIKIKKLEAKIHSLSYDNKELKSHNEFPKNSPNKSIEGKLRAVIGDGKKLNDFIAELRKVILSQLPEDTEPTIVDLLTDAVFVEKVSVDLPSHSLSKLHTIISLVTNVSEKLSSLDSDLSNDCSIQNVNTLCKEFISEAGMLLNKSPQTDSSDTQLKEIIETQERQLQDVKRNYIRICEEKSQLESKIRRLETEDVNSNRIKSNVKEGETERAKTNSVLLFEKVTEIHSLLSNFLNKNESAELHEVANKMSELMKQLMESNGLVSSDNNSNQIFQKIIVTLRDKLSVLEDKLSDVNKEHEVLKEDYKKKCADVSILQREKSLADNKMIASEQHSELIINKLTDEVHARQSELSELKVGNMTERITHQKNLAETTSLINELKRKVDSLKKEVLDTRNEVKKEKKDLQSEYQVKKREFHEKMRAKVREKSEQNSQWYKNERRERFQGFSEWLSKMQLVIREHIERTLESMQCNDLQIAKNELSKVLAKLVHLKIDMSSHCQTD